MLNLVDAPAIVAVTLGWKESVVSHWTERWISSDDIITTDYEVTRSTKRNIHEFHQTGFSQKLGPVKISKMFFFSTCQLRDLTDVKWSISSAADTFRLWSLRKKHRKFHHSERSLNQKKLGAYLSLEERTHGSTYSCLWRGHHLTTFFHGVSTHRGARPAPPSWLLHPKTHPHRRFEPPAMGKMTQCFFGQLMPMFWLQEDVRNLPIFSWYNQYSVREDALNTG